MSAPEVTVVLEWRGMATDTRPKESAPQKPSQRPTGACQCGHHCGNCKRGGRLMAYECFHCGERAVIWCGDFTFEDYMLEGEGIVHECYCTNCGASVTYEVPTPDWGEDDDDDD